MVAINLDVFGALLLTAITSALVTAFVYFVASWVPWHTGNWYRAEIYQERDAKYYQVAAKRPGLGKQSFYVGKDFEFVIPSPAPVLFYYNGRPVLQYILDKARPRHPEIDDKGKIIRVKLEPVKTALRTPPNVKKDGDPKDAKDKEKLPDSESRSVNMFMRRGAIEQMIKATRGIDLKAAIPFVILAGVAAFMLGYVVFLQVHPGMVQAPPPGYYYKAFPIPVNATVNHP